MKNKVIGMVSAAVTLGAIGGTIYYYKKKHPIKTQKLIRDAKDMMKDLK